ncbi:Spc7 kinetochore protein-domain-containing protein [Phlyctochytrium arcticum]|nr:Spc7 kinetochore protein-domain-containing protein [Phlyctochytrium arcticum]
MEADTHKKSKTDGKSALKPRKSSSRRVSFAPKAHIRPFFEGSDQWNTADNEFENREGGNLFQIPDLSSIRRTRDRSYEVDLKSPDNQEIPSQPPTAKQVSQGHNITHDPKSLPGDSEDVPCLRQRLAKKPRDSISALFFQAEDESDVSTENDPRLPLNDDEDDDVEMMDYTESHSSTWSAGMDESPHVSAPKNALIRQSPIADSVSMVTEDLAPNDDHHEQATGRFPQYDDTIARFLHSPIQPSDLGPASPTVTSNLAQAISKLATAAEMHHCDDTIGDFFNPATSTRQSFVRQDSTYRSIRRGSELQSPPHTFTSEDTFSSIATPTRQRVHMEVDQRGNTTTIPEAKELSSPRSNDDIFDEQLSMVEDSLAEDALIEEHNAPGSIAEFLKISNICFADSVDEFERRDPSLYAHAADAAEADYYKAALLWSSELDIYEYGCKELMNQINGLKGDLQAMDEETKCNTPPIFYDLVESLPSEGRQIKDELSKTASLSSAESRSIWRSWRADIVNNLAEDFQCNLKKLEKDERILTRLAGALRSQTHPLEARNREFEQIILDNHTRVEKTIAENKRVSAELAHTRLTNLTKKHDLEQAKSDLQAALQDAKLQAQKLEDQHRSFSQAISRAENICQDLTIFDPEELIHLRGEYQLYRALLPWSTGEASPSTLNLVYKQIVRLKFDRASPRKHWRVQIKLEDKESSLPSLSSKDNGGSSFFSLGSAETVGGAFAGTHAYH